MRLPPKENAHGTCPSEERQRQYVCEAYPKPSSPDAIPDTFPAMLRKDRHHSFGTKYPTGSVKGACHIVKRRMITLVD